MNNIVLFRERRFATKFPTASVLAATAFSPSPARTAPVKRPRLIAVWHTNSQTGKQECFWTTEDHAVSDEDGSHRAA